MKRAYIYLILIMIAAANAACTKEIPYSIKPEYTQYAFNSDASTIRISIESSSPEWTADTDCQWLEAVKSEGDSLEITVSQNTELESRTGQISLSDGYAAATITIVQEGRSFNGKMLDFPQMWPKTTTSHNGRYIVGSSYIDQAGSPQMTITIIDTESGEYSYLSDYSYPGKYMSIVAISDDGTKILINDSRNIAKLLEVDTEGNVAEMDIAPYGEYTTSNAVGMDASGRTIALYAMKESDKYPAMAIDGAMSLLETPEKDPVGQTLPARNITLEGCSADGSIIYGYEVHSTCQGLIYWKNGKCFNAGAEHAEDPQEVLIDLGGYQLERTVASTISLKEGLDCIRTSPDGRYLAARYIYYESNAPGETATIHEYPALVNLETDEITIVKTDIQSVATYTSDNQGNLFGISFDRTGYVFNAQSGSCRTISQYFEEEHNVLLADDRSVSYADSANGIYFGQKDQTTYWFMKTR